MEKIMDFDEWVKNYVPAKIEYMGVYDPKDGSLISVGPSHAFENEQFKVSMDEDLALKILEGRVLFNTCYVDLGSEKIELVEVKPVVIPTTILYRIVDKEWSTTDRLDIYLTCNIAKKTLKIEMSEELSGTKKIPAKYKSKIQRRLVPSNDTPIEFLITDYNDPNIIHTTLSLVLGELIGKSKTFTKIDFPENFSIYTKRVFKNYMVEYT